MSYNTNLILIGVCGQSPEGGELQWPGWSWAGSPETGWGGCPQPGEQSGWVEVELGFSRKIRSSCPPLWTRRLLWPLLYFNNRKNMHTTKQAFRNGISLSVAFMFWTVSPYWNWNVTFFTRGLLRRKNFCIQKIQWNKRMNKNVIVNWQLSLLI